MSFKNIEHTVSADVADSATETVSYPEGTNKGDFFGAYDHRMIFLQSEFIAPRDFTLSFGASNITLTNKTGATITAGTTIRLQLDKIGREDGRVFVQDQEVPGATEIPLLYLNLNAPVANDADGLVTSTTPAGGGSQEITLDGAIVTDGVAELDVPRNITVTSAADETARTFTITGTDVYGETMVEEITGANAGAAAGKKAFSTVTKVEVDADTAGAVEVGFGKVLGVPVFLPDSVFVESELEDNASATSGTVVGADTATPTATTGDVRGTYAPNSAPDGAKTFALIVRHPEPGYLGSPQYEG